MIHNKKNKSNSRNVGVCHCEDPLSILAIPEIQIGLARCLTYRKRRLPEKENTYKDNVDPQKYIEQMENLIASDPNCTPDPNCPRVVHEDISARSLPSVDFFFNNTFMFHVIPIVTVRMIVYRVRYAGKVQAHLTNINKETARTYRHFQDHRAHPGRNVTTITHYLNLI